MVNKRLTSQDNLTKLIKSKGINTWEELVSMVKSLPYGRNSNRTDFKLVITEQKGTCSSKHSFLKKIADLNGVQNVKLILGMYKMDKNNTPNIGNALNNNSIDYIPEAHCYLQIEGLRIDITNEQSDFKKVEKDIIQELEIQPEQVAEFKVEYHKNYIKDWISNNDIEYSFEEVWKIREHCINNLTE